VGIFNVGLVNEMKLGLTSYDNKDTYGFDTFMAEYISSNNLEIAPMRILGKIHTKVDLERAFDRLSLCTNYANFFRGITQVSTDKQYDELNYYARYLLRQKQFQNRSLQVESFKPQGRIRAINPYGLEYSYTFYFFIKSIWHKFKFCFKSIKSKKFIALKKLTPQGLF
jgi:hypothetical protein